MKHPPQSFTPVNVAGTILLGTAARGKHARALDKYQTYLATRPHCVPAMIANAYVAGTTYEIMVPVPCWRQALRFHILAAGRGDVTLTSDDTYNCKVTINHGSGTSHDVADASWVKTGPASAPGENGHNRALDVDDQSSPHDVKITITIADLSASHTLEVYCIQPSFVWHDTETELPS